MRKAIFGTLFTVAGAMLVSGCASTQPMGNLYTDVKLPVDAEQGAGSAQSMGSTSCTSILSLVATGDCSIEAAKKNGNISEVTHVDWEAKNYLGLYGKYTLTVYGN